MNPFASCLGGITKKKNKPQVSTTPVEGRRSTLFSLPWAKSSTKNKNRSSPLLALPEEMFLMILGYLTPEYIMRQNINSVCKTFHRLCNDPSLRTQMRFMAWSHLHRLHVERVWPLLKRSPKLKVLRTNHPGVAKLALLTCTKLTMLHTNIDTLMECHFCKEGLGRLTHLTLWSITAEGADFIAENCKSLVSLSYTSPVSNDDGIALLVFIVAKREFKGAHNLRELHVPLWAPSLLSLGVLGLCRKLEKVTFAQEEPGFVGLVTDIPTLASLKVWCIIEAGIPTLLEEPKELIERFRVPRITITFC